MNPQFPLLFGRLFILCFKDERDLPGCWHQRYKSQSQWWYGGASVSVAWMTCTMKQCIIDAVAYIGNLKSPPRWHLFLRGMWLFQQEHYNVLHATYNSFIHSVHTWLACLQSRSVAHLECKQHRKGENHRPLSIWNLVLRSPFGLGWWICVCACPVGAKCCIWYRRSQHSITEAWTCFWDLRNHIRLV